MAAEGRLPLLIAGAGIGGLTAALACLQAGVAVRVVEKLPELGEVGAGLTLYRNATRALQSLGLLEVVWAESSVPDGRRQVHWQTGDNLVFQPARPLAPGEAPELRVHRADLHAILAAAIRRLDPAAIETGRELVTWHDDGDAVTAHFADGSSARGAALVGADGIRSVVLAGLWGTGAPRFTGWVAWRGLVDVASLPEVARASSSAKYIGDHQELVRYAVRRGRQVNWVGLARQPGWEIMSWTEPASRDELLQRYAGWTAHVRELIAATPEPTLYKWALFDREPLERWSRGRVTLLGDAAHPMLPSIGQGAGLAIEDGVVLARALAADGITPAGLERYEAARRPRTTLAQALARESAPDQTAASLAAYAESAEQLDRMRRQRAFQDFYAVAAPH